MPLGIDKCMPLVGPEADNAMAQAESSEDQEAHVVIIGKDLQGLSVCADIQGYKPWLRVMYSGDPKCQDSQVISSLRALCQQHLRLDYHDVRLDIEARPKFYGFEADAQGFALKRLCCKIYVHSFKQASMLEWHLNRSMQWTITDSMTSKEMRASNELGLTASGWATLESFQYTSTQVSTCKVHIVGQAKNLKPKDSATIAPLKVLSFDAEMYSHDNSFPDPLNGDFAVAICASIMIYGTEGLQRHAFVVHDSSKGQLRPTTDLKVYYCKDPSDMLEQFRDLIVSEDPDLLTGWNIYGFDMPFLWDSYASAHEGPKNRGSEWLHASLMKALGRPFATTDDLLKMKKLGPKSSSRSLIQGLPMRYKSEIHNPEGLPEIVAVNIRAELRKNLMLEPEKTFGGPEDLKFLRHYAQDTETLSTSPGSISEAYDTKRTRNIFKALIDVPKRVSGIKRGRYMGRMALEPSSLTEKRMASSAKGDNTYYIWSGRSCVDLMQIIKDDKKLDDNTLKFAAQTFLDPEFGKLDMTPAEMFKAYRTTDIQGLSDMLDYCARDADIPLLLIQKLNYLPIWVEMSRVTYTSMHQVLNGGQQRKVYNLLAHFVHHTHAINTCDSGWPMSTACPDIDSSDDEFMEDAMVKRKPDYQGATVIEPKTGFYTSSVSTLDFESLYPSIMIHFNLCPSVYVVPGSTVTGNSVIENHTIKHSILVDSKTNSYNDFEKTYGFVKNVQGIVPKLLQHLLNARKVAKKAMAMSTNDFDRSVQNGRQLALKVSCNSVYGFFGVTPGRGLMSCKPVAAVTTLKGRAFIDAAKNYVETSYSGSSVIYGDTDSIMINWGPTIEVPEAYRLAEAASSAITDLLRSGSVEGATKPLLASATSAVTLANEKVYRPYLLIQKKNYAGFKYLLRSKHEPKTLDDFETSVDMKGIDAVRRDRSKLIKTLSGSILDALLIERSLDKAIEHLKATLDIVASQKAPLDWFVLSKSLKGRYKTDNQPHVQAWKRMIARGDQDVPEIGTRMPYVIVRPKGSKTTGPLYTRTEHPDFVALSKLPYCAKYYLENAQDVLERLLGPTGQQQLVAKIFSDAIAKADHLASGNMSLMSFFSKRTS